MAKNILGKEINESAHHVITEGWEMAIRQTMNKIY